MAAMWLRWTWRDLRARWVQVGAIAAIIALGVGTYAGLSSTSEWRRLSYDASYRRLAAHDLRATVATGAYVDAARLKGVGARLISDGTLAAAAVELEGPVQVDASTRGTVLVPGRLIGIEPTLGGPAVDRLFVTHGRGFRPGDTRGDVVVVDEHFAARREVRAGDTIRVSGDHALRVVGRGASPEHFLVLGDSGVFVSDAGFALTYVPLETAQRVLGPPGAANVLVVRSAPGVPVSRARASLEHALAEELPDAAITVVPLRQDRAYRLLYDDIQGDQRLYDIFALLILLGAAFAAFNLTARIVEAQRREIGIGMALGVPPRSLAVRPLLIGVQIALLGVVLGAVVGLGVGALMIAVLRGYFPLPVWRQDFQVATFVRGAALGLLLPFVATVIPVWRAVRVAPVDAISTGARARRRAPMRHAPRFSGRGRSIAVLPLRNVLRDLRRTALTALGIAASIAVLLGVIGMLDSFYATIDHARTELTSRSPRRLTVELSSFVPEDAPAVVATRTSPLVARSMTELRLPATVARGSTSIDLLLVVGDLDSHLWRPTVQQRIDRPGIVLTRKAVDDLGVAVGRWVDVRYPRREGLGYRYVRSRLRVVGVSPFPLRSIGWMDTRDGAKRTNLAGITNEVVVDPRPGVRAAQVERAFFSVPGVTAVQPVTEYTDALRREIDRALGILRVVEGAVLVLALLIAFNTASINADDRAREHATMFAFGLPVRTVGAMEVTESLIIGILGTVVGLVAGWVLLDWLTTSLLPTTLPDLSIVTALSLRTIGLAVAMGVLAVGLAPLLTIRKLRRMDVPSTLRVVE